MSHHDCRLRPFVARLPQPFSTSKINLLFKNICKFTATFPFSCFLLLFLCNFYTHFYVVLIFYHSGKSNKLFPPKTKTVGLHKNNKGTRNHCRINSLTSTTFQTLHPGFRGRAANKSRGSGTNHLSRCGRLCSPQTSKLHHLGAPQGTQGRSHVHATRDG